MKRVNVFLVVLVALAMASSMWAQGLSHQKACMQGMMKGQGMHMMMDSECPMMETGHMQGFFLNQAEAMELSDSQLEQLQKIKTATQKAIIKKEADLRILQLELDELMEDSKAKRSNLEAKAKKVEELRSDIRLTVFKAKLDARSVLTPEQLKKVKSMKMPGMQGMMQMDSQEKKGACPMMGDGVNNPKGKDDSSEHEKHHPNNG